MLFAEHQLCVAPDLAKVKDFQFPAFLLDVGGSGWNQIAGAKLELLPQHPEVGNPLKVRPGVPGFERNFLAHHRVVPAPVN